MYDDDKHVKSRPLNSDRFETQENLEVMPPCHDRLYVIVYIYIHVYDYFPQKHH